LRPAEKNPEISIVWEPGAPVGRNRVQGSLTTRVTHCQERKPEGRRSVGDLTQDNEVA